MTTRKKVIAEIKDQLWDLHILCEKLSNYYSSCYTMDGFDDDSIWTTSDLRECKIHLRRSIKNLEKYVGKYIDSEEWEDYC